ncbi:MAG: putative capsular polysaccharide synthesis family protein [Cyanobacteria bacterium P01_D01_bin.44]
MTDAGIEAFKPPPPVIPDPLPPLSELPQRDALLAAITQVDYLAANPDLPGVIKSDEDARAHFDAKGFHQNRRWKPGLLDYFDTKYYRRRYSRLPLSSAAAAERHYALVGIFEGRFPNLATEHMWNARIHLFQMGKVGSKAIEAGIAVASGESCIHVHWADFWEQQRPHIRIPYSQLLAHPRKQPVLVLTGVRDPFSRLVSGWFQEFESRKRDRSLMTWEQAKKEISARFHSDALRIVNWFEHRFYCELDVYAQPFDTTAGYVTLEHPWMLVFVYRQDALPRLIEPLREFLGMPNFNLEPSNISNQKWYADVYRQTFEQFRLPEDAVKACLATQYMQHFFTEAERADMANRWID